MTSPDGAPKQTLDALIDQYRAELDEHPDDADSHYNIGLALMCEGRTDEAIESFENARRLAPEFGETYRLLAILHARRGRHDRATEILDELLQREPGNARASALRDRLRRGQG